MEEENLERLPKWAQREVRVLMMRLAEANVKIDQLIENPVTRVYIHKHYRHPEYQYLSDRDPIRFDFGNHQFIDVHLDVKRNNVHVMASRAININPIASNVVTIELGDC